MSTDYRKIMRLLLERRSYRDVAATVGCSHQTVAAAKKQVEEQNLTIDRLAQLTDQEVTALFPDGRSRVRAEYLKPEFSKVVASFKKNQHYTLLQGWRSYTGKPSELRKYGYSQYCALFSEYVKKHDLTAVLKHTPGRTLFIDWAGDTIDLVDAVTGAVTKAYLFVTVLPYSGYLWCHAFTDMRMPSWIAGHVGAFEFYGGVPQLLIPDYVARHIIGLLFPDGLCSRGASTPHDPGGSRAWTQLFGHIISIFGARVFLPLNREIGNYHVRAVLQ